MEMEEVFEYRGEITSDGQMDFDNFLGSTVPIVFLLIKGRQRSESSDQKRYLRTCGIVNRS